MNSGTRFWAALMALTLAPALHPLLIPWAGVASHLLWWVHVLPVAMLVYRYGSVALVSSIVGSVGLLVLGERLFGFGYGVPADRATIVSLSIALAFTEALVAGFALYTRRVTRGYRILFEGTENGVIRTDAEGRILEVNPAAEAVLGKSRGQMLGTRIGSIEGLKDLPPLSVIESRGGWTGSIETDEDESVRTSHYIVAAFGQDDPEGHQVILMDRTKEVAAELEWSRQRKLATLGESLAGVAHELRNPLAVIMAEIELARTDPDVSREELLESMSGIGRQAERIRGLADELLGYSRAPSGEGTVRIDKLLRRLLKIEEMVRGRAIRWEERIEWEGEVRVPELRLEQVVTNLLSNAAEAMVEGRGELHCRREGERIEIEVLDTGPGIPEELMDRIFSPFVTTRGDSGGTGLGLAISRRLAIAMGGTLTARNRPTGGAAFHLSLPVGVPDSPLPPDDRGQTPLRPERRSVPDIPQPR